MNIQRRASHLRHFVSISSVVFLTLLLAACGGAAPSGKTVALTPSSGAVSTTVPMPPTQTSCPPAGKARAAIMAPLAQGKQATFVYLNNNTLKRYNVSTRTTTDITSVPAIDIGSDVSADGQWVIFKSHFSGQSVMQLVRMDGQGLQTLYCASGGGFSWMQWSPDNKYVAFVDLAGQEQSTWTLKLLNTTTGAIQANPHDSTHVLEAPLAWLDNTHLYVVSGLGPGEGSQKLSLLDITTGIIKQILDLSHPEQCIDATHSIDGTQLFTSITSQCHLEGSTSTPTSNGPSSIEVQSATGGLAKTIFSMPTYAIKALRIATGTSLLLIIHNASTETSHNGLWKVNTDGTGLTMLSSEKAIIKDAANEEMDFRGLLGWNMDQPWANASRDGAYYSILVLDHQVQIRLLIGSMNGGAPVTIVSGSLVAPVGWTTM